LTITATAIQARASTDTHTHTHTHIHKEHKRIIMTKDTSRVKNTSTLAPFM